jgi:hypothetical protein
MISQFYIYFFIKLKKKKKIEILDLDVVKNEGEYRMIWEEIWSCKKNKILFNGYEY